MPLLLLVMYKKTVGCFQPYGVKSIYVTPSVETVNLDFMKRKKTLFFADRVTSLMQVVLRDLDPELVFLNGDKLWQSFQKGIFNFVNNHGGLAVIPETKISERHAWENVSELLLAKEHSKPNVKASL